MGFYRIRSGGARVMLIMDAMNMIKNASARVNAQVVDIFGK